MTSPHIAVIGAGAGGLAAAADLARQGLQVSLFDAGDAPGGKMRQLPVGGRGIDAGPTVFTMRWVFAGLFGDAGIDFDKAVVTEKASILARHAWTSGGQLDLHADIDASAAAICAFAGEAEAKGFLDFCQRSADIHATLRDSFMSVQQPSPLGLVRRVGLGNLGRLIDTVPQRTLWSALADHFQDSRLQQLFGRYATYVGSSPLQTPATLMLIAHVEQDGVWLLPGGMLSLASAMASLGEQFGVVSHYQTPVDRIRCNSAGRVCGVSIGSDTLAADAVVFAGDNAALSAGLLGDAVRTAVPSVSRQARGLSALTWCVNARPKGFDLHYHNVFFAEDYPSEFTTIFDKRGVPDTPTVYLCAQDRLGGREPEGAERMLVLINSPADGDRVEWTPQAIDDRRACALDVLERCGLELEIDEAQATSPTGFAQRFPGSGGSLYGRASHGMMSSFSRPGSRSKIPGLYLAGGSVHPGPGVPMATLSGRLAAEVVIEDLEREGRFTAGADRRQKMH